MESHSFAARGEELSLGAWRRWWKHLTLLFRRDGHGWEQIKMQLGKPEWGAWWTSQELNGGDPGNERSLERLRSPAQ